MKYCDGIAAICRSAIREWIDGEFENAIQSVGPIRYDLHEDGYLLSTTKTISVEDVYGQKYKITIEEEQSMTMTVIELFLLGMIVILSGSFGYMLRCMQEIREIAEKAEKNQIN